MAMMYTLISNTGNGLNELELFHVHSRPFLIQIKFPVFAFE